MKNPFMSMWLSAANRAAGTARGMWMAEAKKQQTAAVKKMSKPPASNANRGKSASKGRGK